MSAVHLILMGSNACAVTFPDAQTEPLDAIMAKLRNAANAVAYMASIEHERAAEVYPPHIAGALTAIEVLTCLSEALQIEAQTQRATITGGAGHE